MADVYYDDQKRLIANDLAGLIIYFQSLGGTTTVQNVPYTLDCPMYALLRVNSDVVMPKFIYKNGFSPANKIYMQQLPGNSLNLGSLCNGVNNSNIVPAPVLGVFESAAIDFYTTEDGTENYTNEINFALTIE